MLTTRFDHLSADDVSQAWLRTLVVLKSILARVSAWRTVSANYYEAAAIYDDLARLSDVELHRRGLSRETLARDVCETCERLKPLDPKTMAFW